MYTLQSLWTQVREGLDVTTVLLNNGSYAILELELDLSVALDAQSSTDLRREGHATLLIDLNKNSLCAHVSDSIVTASLCQSDDRGTGLGARLQTLSRGQRGGSNRSHERVRL